MLRQELANRAGQLLETYQVQVTAITVMVPAMAPAQRGLEGTVPGTVPATRTAVIVLLCSAAGAVLCAAVGYFLVQRMRPRGRSAAPRARRPRRWPGREEDFLSM